MTSMFNVRIMSMWPHWPEERNDGQNAAWCRDNDDGRRAREDKQITNQQNVWIFTPENRWKWLASAHLRQLNERWPNHFLFRTQQKKNRRKKKHSKTFGVVHHIHAHIKCIQMDFGRCWGQPKRDGCWLFSLTAGLRLDKPKNIRNSSGFFAQRGMRMFVDSYILLRHIVLCVPTQPHTTSSLWVFD